VALCVCVCVCVSGIRYTAHPMWEDVKAESIMALPTVPDMSAGFTTQFTCFTSQKY
jgi:hypothetical protein